MSYDYKDSKRRVDDILSSKTEIVKKDKIPSSDDEFTYSNGIKSWAGAIFVDMVGSSDLCKTSDEKTARIFRAFCSEIIAILKDVRKLGHILANRNRVRRLKAVIKILFVCWGERFSENAYCRKRRHITANRGRQRKLYYRNTTIHGR